TLFRSPAGWALLGGSSSTGAAWAPPAANAQAVRLPASTPPATTASRTHQRRLRWGVCEPESATVKRHYLRSDRGLSGFGRGRGALGPRYRGCRFGCSACLFEHYKLRYLEPLKWAAGWHASPAHCPRSCDKHSVQWDMTVCDRTSSSAQGRR